MHLKDTCPAQHFQQMRQNSLGQLLFPQDLASGAHKTLNVLLEHEAVVAAVGAS